MRAASATTLLILFASAAAQSSFRGTHASHDRYLTSISSMNPRNLMMVFAQTTASSAAGNNTETHRTCNSTKLVEMLQASTVKDASCQGFAEFNTSFMHLPAHYQSERLEAFCSGQCKSFDKTLSEWRQWCTSREATFNTTLTPADPDRALQATNTSATHEGTLDKPFNWFGMLGCSKDSHGSFCFNTVAHAVRSDDCAFTGTCCWAEMKKVMPDMEASDLGPTCQDSTESCSA